MLPVLVNCKRYWGCVGFVQVVVNASPLIAGACHELEQCVSHFILAADFRSHVGNHRKPLFSWFSPDLNTAAIVLNEVTVGG